MPPDFRLNYKAVVIETVWYWHKKTLRSMGQNKEVNWSVNLWQSIYNGEKSVFLMRSAGKNGQLYVKMKLLIEHFSHQYNKLNSKWIKDLNVRLETMKLLENIGRTIFNINHSNVLFDLLRQRKQQKKTAYGMGENVCK